MSDRQSKRRGRGQFLPRVLCLEDRTVPATYFVDPNFAGATAGDTVAFNTEFPGQQVSGLTFAGDYTDWQTTPTRTAFASFAEALQAANDTTLSPGLDTIRVAGSATPIDVENATTPDDPVAGNALQVTDDLIIQGSGQGATVLAPTGDTTFGGVADEFTAIFRTVGPALTVTDLTLDAAGKQVGFGFDVGGGTTATFDRVTIRNVQFDLGGTVEGTGITAFDGDVTDADEVVLNVLNSTIENTGLHAIAYDGADGTVSGATINGRGADAFTNAQNGVQIVGDSTVLITGSTISGFVAGAASSGVAVSETDAGDPTIDGAPTVTLIGNTLTANTIGLTVGPGATDASVVSAQFNNIAGNLQGTNDTTPVINAPNNYWGSPTGPFQNPGNTDGTGNEVSANTVIDPFLTGPTPVVPAATPAAYIAAISTVGVSVSPAAGQTEPVPSGPVEFQVVFAQPVTGFDNPLTDVTVVSSPGGTPVVTITPVSATTYTVTVTGLAGVGEVAIQIPADVATTADGFRNSASGVASVDFGVTPNTPPQISPIANQTTQVGTATTPAGFTVTDTETPEAALIVTATSSNPAVVPNGAIVLGGAGANRTVSVTPIAAGTATITVTVQDASGATSSTAFTVNATTPPENTPPTISALVNQSSAVGTPSVAQTITVGDAQSDPATLTVTATSSNQTVVPNGSIVVSGTGANRTISFTPAAEGTATITVTVTDPNGASTTGTFVATGTTVPPLPDPTVLLGTEEYAAGPGITGGPIVRYFNPDGSERLSATVFAEGFTGGVRTAVGDFNLDGTPDIAVGTGPGSVTAVRVLDGLNPSVELFRIIPFEETFTGGVYVAVGDMNADGRADLVITPDEGGGPRARVFVTSKNLTTGGVNFDLAADFLAIEDPAFRGGARAAIADVNGDGSGDLLVAAGFGGGPRVAGFDGKSVAAGNTSVKLFADFFVFEPTLANGIFIAGGDINGDGFADVIAGGGPGGGPRVFAVSGKDILTNTRTQLANFFAGDTDNRGGVRVTAKNLDGDDRADLVVGDGTGAGSTLTAYTGSTIPTDGLPPELYEFEAFAGFANGIYVG
jgi:hypothetical protein